MLRLLDIRRLMKTAEELGGSTPSGVVASLHTLDNLRAGVVKGTKDPDAEVKAAFRQAIELGQETTVEFAEQIFRDMAKANLVQSQVGRYLGESLDFQVAAMIRDALRGEAGDQLMLGLQDRVNVAIQGVARSAGFYSQDASLEAVVEIGDEAVQAWREAGTHGDYLDKLTVGVVRELAFLDDLIPPELKKDQGQILMASFWVGLDRANAEVLAQVGRTFFTPSTSFSVPAGRWLKIYQTANGLRLNSPRQAIEVLSKLKYAEDQEDFVRYAPKKSRSADVTYAEDDDQPEAPGIVGFQEVH